MLCNKGTALAGPIKRLRTPGALAPAYYAFVPWNKGTALAAPQMAGCPRSGFSDLGYLRTRPVQIHAVRAYPKIRATAIRAIPTVNIVSLTINGTLARRVNTS